VDNHCLVSQAIPYDDELRAVGRIPPFNPTYGMGIIRNKNRRVGWRHTTFADLSPVIANPPHTISIRRNCRARLEAPINLSCRNARRASNPPSNLHVHCINGGLRARYACLAPWSQCPQYPTGTLSRPTFWTKQSSQPVGWIGVR